MKNELAHEILVGLCQVRNLTSSALGKEDPLTPRANYIIDKMLDLDLANKINTDVFEDSYSRAENSYYMNIELTFDAGTDTSVMFIAHHDVNNPNSDNCQDNSASVSNLLALADHLRDNPPAKTVYIVFTDCEEFGGDGAIRLSNKINNGDFGEVEYVVNLELTANGRNLWHDGQNIEGESALKDLLNEKANFFEAKTPFNDSVPLRKVDIDSVCIGTLTENQLAKVADRGYCETWALCHKANDVIGNAVSSDMDNFVEFLTELV